MNKKYFPNWSNHPLAGDELRKHREQIRLEEEKKAIEAAMTHFPSLNYNNISINSMHNYEDDNFASWNNEPKKFRKIIPPSVIAAQVDRNEEFDHKKVLGQTANKKFENLVNGLDYDIYVSESSIFNHVFGIFIANPKAYSTITTYCQALGISPLKVYPDSDECFQIFNDKELANYLFS